MIQFLGLHARRESHHGLLESMAWDAIHISREGGNLLLSGTVVWTANQNQKDFSPIYMHST